MQNRVYLLWAAWMVCDLTLQKPVGTDVQENLSSSLQSFYTWSEERLVEHNFKEVLRKSYGLWLCLEQSNHDFTFWHAAGFF